MKEIYLSRESRADHQPLSIYGTRRRRYTTSRFPRVDDRSRYCDLWTDPVEIATS